MGVVSSQLPGTTAHGEAGIERPFSARATAGLLATMPALPLFAIVATVTLYVSTAGTTNNTLLYGLLIGVAGWLAVGSVAATFNTGPRANSGVYSELLARVQAVEIELGSARTRLGVSAAATTPDGPMSESDSYERAALTELSHHVRALARDFGGYVVPDAPPAFGTRLASRQWDVSGDQAVEIKSRGGDTVADRAEERP